MIPERSYEIPFELKRSVPTHISREVLLHITGFTSDQRIEQKFSFLMTDKASVKGSAEAEWTCTLKTAYTKNNPKNVKRLEIGKKRHPRSYLLRITNQTITTHYIVNTMK